MTSLGDLFWDPLEQDLTDLNVVKQDLVLGDLQEVVQNGVYWVHLDLYLELGVMDLTANPYHARARRYIVGKTKGLTS